jgi:hypothetical protein
MDALGFPGQGGFAFESSKYDAGSIPPNKALNSRGMGCCGLGALTMDGSGLFGTGVFGGGVSVADLSTWTWAEYAAVGLSLFVVFSVFSTTKQGVTGVRKTLRRKRSARAAVSQV